MARIDDLRDINTELERQAAMMEHLQELGVKVDGATAARIQQERAALELEEERLRLAGAISDADLKRIDSARKQIEANERALKSADSLAKRVLGITEESGRMFEVNAESVGKMGLRFKELLTPTRIFGSLVQKTFETTLKLAEAQDKAVKQFKMATGASNKYNKGIIDLETSMYNVGVNTEEAAAATTSLYNTVTDFTEMGSAQRQVLSENVALLAEMGVSTDASAKSMQFFIKVQGDGAKQAAGNTRKLFKFAQQLGVSAEKIQSDFAEAQDLVAALGETGVQAFMELEAQAKATGLEMSTLLGLVEKFDTFESAANQVGKLNAILGGPYLNTLEMVTETDPAERMRKLSEGILASGVSFDDMSYYQRKAMTSAAGLNSEMELALLLSGKMETARGPLQTTADFEKMQAEAKDFQTVLDQLTQLGRAFAFSMAPIIPMVKQIIDGLTKMAPLLKFIALIAGLIALKMSIVAVASAIGSGGLTLAAGAGAIALLGTAGYFMGDTQGELPVAKFHKGGHGSGPALVKNDESIVNLGGGSKVLAAGSAEQSRATSQAPAAAPIVNVTVKIGDKEIQEIVKSVEVDTRNLNDKLANSINKNIVQPAIGNA